MKYIVYKHTNLSNGKSYVGVTSTSIEKRWLYGYYGCPKFYKAIKKHGWDGFSHEVLAICYDKDVAFETEAAMIEKFDCIDNGYNTSKGLRNMVCSEPIPVDKYDINTGELICTYPSITEAAKDVGASDAGISGCCKGKHTNIAGYGWAYHGETYKKPSKYSLFSKIEQLDPKTGDVIEVYDSQKDAAKALGVSKSLINMCCKGKLNTGAGYAWRYAK